MGGFWAVCWNLGRDTAGPQARSGDQSPVNGPGKLVPSLSRFPISELPSVQTNVLSFSVHVVDMAVNTQAFHSLTRVS